MEGQTDEKVLAMTENPVPTNKVLLTVSKRPEFRQFWKAVSVISIIIALVYLYVLIFKSKEFVVNNFLKCSYKSSPIAYPVARNSLSIDFVILLFISHLADQVACGNICIF